MGERRQQVAGIAEISINAGDDSDGFTLEKLRLQTSTDFNFIIVF